MTFFRQMVLLMSGFILLILVSIMLLNFHAATEQVQNQLYVSAQDTVSSLSLSLGTAKGETSAIETMINAIYDSGHYKRIVLNGNDGNEIYSRSSEFSEDNTPLWFKNIFPLIAPPASAYVSNGWIPIGILEVTSLESEAYKGLYKTFNDIVRTFSVISVATFTLLYILLNLSLKSLKKMKKQADSISKNEFVTNESIPFTREFRDVTIAMNTMVLKVRDIFTKEAETLKRYHELIYKDEVTSLANRRFLILKINEYLNSNTVQSNGIMFFINIDNLMKANNEMGHNEVDQLLRSFAEILKTEAAGVHENICARINGPDFAVLLPGMELEASQKIANRICELSQQLFQDLNAKDLELYLSILAYKETNDVSNIFSKADYGLSQCKLQEAFSIYKDIQTTATSLLGKQEFFHIIVNAMDENRLTMALQPVQNLQSETIYHEEAYLRLIDSDGEVFSAGYFLPMIYASNLQVDVDKYMINHIIAHDKVNNNAIAINITSDFIKDSSNMQWLYETLSSANLKHSLYFEISNSAILENIEATINFSKVVKSFGHFFGVDRFVVNEHGLDYLQQIAPDYLKINQTYLNDLTSNENERHSNVLNNIIKALDIKLIATSVETKEAKEWLIKHEYYHMQGDFILDTKLVDIV